MKRFTAASWEDPMVHITKTSKNSKPYKNFFLLCFLLLGLLLQSCVPQNSGSTPLNLHDIYFYDGTGGLRYSIFYGEPRDFNSGEQTLRLTSSLTSDATKVPPLSFPEALYVNNLPYLESSLEQRPVNSFTASRSRFTSDINFQANEALSEVVYYDGFFWFTLATNATTNLDAVITPKRRFQKLQGFGQLTNGEAQALSNYYESLDDSLVIGLFAPTDTTQANPRAANFETYRETQVYIQRGIPLNDELVSTAVNGVRWEVLASGTEESIDRSANSFEIATNAADFSSLWNVAHAKSLNPPSRPNLNLERESILGIFLSSRRDENYNLDIIDAVEESGEIYLDVKLIENTLDQPLFSTTGTDSENVINPWVLVRILEANVPVVWIRDANSGDLLGVARR